MAVKRDCEHYNKHRCNCKLLKKLYCKIEEKPCVWYKPSAGGGDDKEIKNVRSRRKNR